MKPIIVAGIGTGVGKTVVSAILCTLLSADYWKPVETGEEKDSQIIKKCVSFETQKIYHPCYSLKAPLSPHTSPKLEGIKIDLSAFKLPKNSNPLIIESTGGILVPLTLNVHTFDLFSKWDACWIVVSQHSLGSINHTLLTLDYL
jgi:dethiobiotin synthetase